MFNLFLVLDWYGDGSRRDPRRHPRSYTGALFTVLGCASCALLIGYTSRDYAAKFDTVRFGGRSQLNGIFKTLDASDDSNETKYLIQTWPDFLVPSLELSFRTDVISYDNSNRSSVFKIDVVDKTGYQRTLTSSLSNTPVGYAIYNSHQVPPTHRRPADLSHTATHPPLSYTRRTDPASARPRRCRWAASTTRRAARSTPTTRPSR
jgi:hypothetical protein